MFPPVQFVFVLSIFVQISTQVSDPNSATYVAAVVEYYPLENSSLTAEERTVGNVDNYLTLLGSVDTELDIVVFPEATITSGFRSTNRSLLLEHATLVPAPDENVTPCNRTGEFLQYLVNLSCGAQQYNTYIAANVLEKHSCTGETCASDGWDVFNTNVVFDRNGTVVARYRKYNLFGEYSLNQTSEPELSIFTTDFNVTFGQFICFDLLFDAPTNALMRSGVHDLIFSTMWFSELPFLTAPQSQKQFAYENNVNLLSSGANNPRVGSGGSGIFQGKGGAHEIAIIAEGGSRIFVANVTKYNQTTSSANIEITASTLTIDEEGLQLDNFYLKRENLSPYASRLLNTSQTATIEENLCSGDEENLLCCDFHIRITVNNSTSADSNVYQYKILALSGVRSFDGVYNGGIETCGIVACINETLEGCGIRFDNYSTVLWPITFENITIRANYSSASYKIQYPNSVRSNILPLPVSSIEWASQEYAQQNLTERTYRLVEPQDRLVTFAIFGRDYSRDSDPNAEATLPSPSSSSTLVAVKVVIVLAYFASFYFSL